MARRYGGRFSPGAATAEAPAIRRRPMAARSNLLFAAPFLLLPGAFIGSTEGLVAGLAAFGLLQGAAWLTREGLTAQAAYEARATARRPAIPRKILGSLATALGLGAAAVPDGALSAALLGLLGGGLHFGAFGSDPLTDKAAPDADPHDSSRVARAVDEAEAHIAAMRAALAPLRDRRLTERVERFEATASAMFREVESDPRDLVAARRYLGVYLVGARDATTKFADYWSRSRDQGARRDWEALMDDLETNFAARTERLAIGNRQGLDIEIEVLRDRLEREGVRPE
jgi:hypothetical protein